VLGNNKSKPSIVISGWPAVGKTTIAKELANEFGFKMYNGGDILKMIAGQRGYVVSGKEWWDSTEESKKFMSERKLNLTFDRQVDKKLVNIAKKGNVVITSYTLPWLIKDSIKVWLKGSYKSRAKRMATRDNMSITEAKKIISSRDEENEKIYRNLYGFNFGEDLCVFDFILNTDLLNLDSLINISKNIIKDILSQKK